MNVEVGKSNGIYPGYKRKFGERAYLLRNYKSIDAEKYMYIDCLWVAGSLKGHGYANELLNYCMEDSKQKGKKGLCILSCAKKKPFLSDPKFLKYKGFEPCDEADNGVRIWYLPFLG